MKDGKVRSDDPVVRRKRPKSCWKFWSFEVARDHFGENIFFGRKNMRGYGWTVFFLQRNCFEIMIACLFKLDMMKKNVSILNDEHYISGFFIRCIQKM